MTADWCEVGTQAHGGWPVTFGTVREDTIILMLCSGLLDHLLRCMLLMALLKT